MLINSIKHYGNNYMIPGSSRVVLRNECNVVESSHDFDFVYENVLKLNNAVGWYTPKSGLRVKVTRRREYISLFPKK